MQNELDNWLNKYDDFMDTQNGKIAEIQVIFGLSKQPQNKFIQAEYDTEKADMTDLQEKFIKLKGNFISYLSRLKCLQRNTMQLCTSGS